MSAPTFVSAEAVLAAYQARARWATRTTARTDRNQNLDWSDAYRTWAAALAAGRSYLVGEDLTPAAFLRRYTSSLAEWQRLAYSWAKQNPAQQLTIAGQSYIWVVRVRGEYVEFALPHQDHGGERYWISRDGRRKVLVNAD